VSGGSNEFDALAGADHQVLAPLPRRSRHGATKRPPALSKGSELPCQLDQMAVSS